MDEIDRAQANTEIYEDAAMRSHLARQQYSGGIPAIKGFCEDCYHPIPAARLEANPKATRCIGCQTKAEKETE